MLRLYLALLFYTLYFKGAYIEEVLKPAFDESLKAGKPWQIWAANTMMGPYILPPVDQFFLDVPDVLQGAVKSSIDAVLSKNQSLMLRAQIAMANSDMQWNRDDYK